MKNLFYITTFFLLIILGFRGYGQEDHVVKKIEFHGNEPIPGELLLNQMNSRGETLIEKLKFWKKEPVLSSFMLKEDVERLRTFYQRNGYLDPEVTYNINWNKKKATIHINIETGEPVLIRDVAYSDLTDEEKTAILSKAIRNQPFSKGYRFVDTKILEYEAEISKKFHNNGYPFIEVKRELDVDTSIRKVDIHYDINPHVKAYFGETLIKGDSLVEESFIRKQLKFNPGEIYSQEKIEKTQQKLFNTDIFSYVVIRPQKDQVKQKSIPISVELEELPPWSLEAGLGYGTEDRLRVSARLTKLHFLGGARKFIFTGKRSHFYPVSLETKLIQPNLLTDNLNLILNPFYISENETSYRVERLGSGLTLQQIFSPSTTGFFMYSLERNFLENKTESDSISGKIRKDIHNKSGITIGMTRNTTNNPFSPTKGWKFNGNFTLMGIGFKSKYDYYKSEIGINRYYQLDKDWILAGKLNAGFIKPFSGDESPIEDRFLIGGASSLRGWGRHQIAPKNEEGKLIGGNSMLEGSLELRFPIYDIFSGVTFMDAGNVWNDAFDYDLKQLRYNAGLGLRVNTPIGPVRLDFATPVFENRFRLQFFVSIGHAF